ncbi:helix-turn-helix domain-containing protein [Chitinophaga lutea]
MLSSHEHLSLKLDAIRRVGDDLPAVVIIHNIATQSVEYMSPAGMARLQTNMDALREMGPEYFQRFFNPQESAEYVPRIMELVQSGDDDRFVSFFHQVRTSREADWDWYLGATQIFLRDDEGKPSHTITFAMPIEPVHHITAKLNRLLDENNFLRRNKLVFASLTGREKEILKLTALGHNSAEMAAALNISGKTVSTHRRNIKHKLGVQSSYDITRFAQAFDLI